jgi:hypothetical protein
VSCAAGFGIKHSQSFGARPHLAFAVGACSNIDKVLGALNTCLLYNNPDAAQHATTQAAIRKLYDGEFPWRVPSTGTSNGTEAAQRHYALRWRLATAQRDRTKEEEGMLLGEVLRVFNWLEVHLGYLDGRSTLLAAEAAECTAKAAAVGAVQGAEAVAAAHKIHVECAAELELIEGKTFVLGREKARLQGIKAQAEKALPEATRKRAAAAHP